MMTTQEIRGWLLQHPRASTLRVITTDDRHHEVSVSSGVSWMAIAQSVHALSPMVIEAYDSKGAIIRAIRPEDLDDDETGGPKTPQPLVMPTNLDPQSTMMVHFADLLAAAYRHATDVAFERLVGLFETAMARVDALERSHETMARLLSRTVQEAQEAEVAQPKEQDLLSQMVQGFTAAAQHNGAPPPATSNGKAD